MNANAIRNLDVVQGETILIRIIASNSGVAVDLTGYVFVGQIRANNNALLASFSFDTSMLQSGQVTAIVDRFVSATIPGGLHDYDIFATSPDGVETAVARGFARFARRISA